MCITLPHYYWLLSQISCPFQFLQLVVDVEACPGIGGGIQFLRFGQGFGFPVGKALAFRNLSPKRMAYIFCRLLSWMPKARTYSCNSMHACCSKGARLCSIMKSSRKERPTFVTLGFSSNVITGRVSPVRLRRNRKQCSSEESVAGPPCVSVLL